MSKLIVAIPWTYPSAEQVSVAGGTTPTKTKLDYDFVLATNDGNNSNNSGQAPMDLLPSAETTLLVAPAKALSWHQIDLPKVPKARLRAALDGILEERLLDDTQTLAFALEPAESADKSTGKVWVAVCDKAWLASAISLFESNGHRVTQVVPEFSPATANSSDAIYVTGVADAAYITRMSATGIFTQPLQKTQLAQYSLGGTPSGITHLDEDTELFAEPAVAELAEQILSRRVTIRQQSTALLQSSQTTWDLAQFDLRLSGDSEYTKRFRRALQSFWQESQWRPVRWGLLGIFLVNVIGLNAWAWHQKSSLAAKKNQVSMLLTHTFPNVKTVIDPVLQMEKEMVRLRQNAGAVSLQNFETILSTFSLINQSNALIKQPTAIEYSGNKVVLTGIDLAANDLASAQAKLKQAGYALIMDGNRVTITVQAGS